MSAEAFPVCSKTQLFKFFGHFRLNKLGSCFFWGSKFFRTLQRPSTPSPSSQHDLPTLFLLLSLTPSLWRGKYVWSLLFSNFIPLPKLLSLPAPTHPHATTSEIYISGSSSTLWETFTYKLLNKIIKNYLWGLLMLQLLLSSTDCIRDALKFITAGK